MTVRLAAHQVGQVAATRRAVAPGPRLRLARAHRQSPGCTTTSAVPGTAVGAPAAAVRRLVVAEVVGQSRAGGGPTAGELVGPLPVLARSGGPVGQSVRARSPARPAPGVGGPARTGAGTVSGALTGLTSWMPAPRGGCRWSAEAPAIPSTPVATVTPRASSVTRRMAGGASRPNAMVARRPRAPGRRPSVVSATATSSQAAHAQAARATRSTTGSNGSVPA